MPEWVISVVFLLLVAGLIMTFVRLVRGPSLPTAFWRWNYWP